MQACGAVNKMQRAAQLRLEQAVASSDVWSLITSLRPNPGHSTILLTCLSLCNTHAQAVNLIHSVLCDDEGVTQALRLLETRNRQGSWEVTLYTLLPRVLHCFFYDPKRQHLSTIKTDGDLSFTIIQQQTYCRRQLMDQADDNSLTALLTKKSK